MENNEILQETAQAESIENNVETNDTTSSNIKKLFNNKKAVICIAGIVLVIIAFFFINNDPFEKVVDKILDEYPMCDNTKGADGSYLKIDTNPDDVDPDELLLPEYEIFASKQEDSIGGIRLANELLDFPQSVYEKMLETTSLMGRQSESNDKYIVSWSYHPDRGLEVMYEKK